MDINQRAGRGSGRLGRGLARPQHASVGGSSNPQLKERKKAYVRGRGLRRKPGTMCRRPHVWGAAPTLPATVQAPRLLRRRPHVASQRDQVTEAPCRRDGGPRPGASHNQGRHAVAGGGEREDVLGAAQLGKGVGLGVGPHHHLRRRAGRQWGGRGAWPFRGYSAVVAQLALGEGRAITCRQRSPAGSGGGMHSAHAAIAHELAQITLRPRRTHAPAPPLLAYRTTSSPPPPHTLFTMPRHRHHRPPAHPPPSGPPAHTHLAHPALGVVAAHVSQHLFPGLCLQHALLHHIIALQGTGSRGGQGGAGGPPGGAGGAPGGQRGRADLRRAVLHRLGTLQGPPCALQPQNPREWQGTPLDTCGSSSTPRPGPSIG